MGCASVKEKLESQMMILKLERVDIMTERDEKIKQLEQMTGQTVVRPEVPDYIAKEQITIDPKVPHNDNVTNKTEEIQEETNRTAKKSKGKKKKVKKEKKKETEESEEEESEDEEKEEEEEEEESEEEESEEKDDEEEEEKSKEDSENNSKEDSEQEESENESDV